MTNGDGVRQAVILSGGGASGAYEVGVLKGLFAGDSSATNYTPLMPDIFTGTSIGAYNASLLVAEINSRGFAAIDHLEDIWLNVLPQDDDTGHNFVARYRGDPFEYLAPRLCSRTRSETRYNWLRTCLSLPEIFTEEASFSFFPAMISKRVC